MQKKLFLKWIYNLSFIKNVLVIKKKSFEESIKNEIIKSFQELFKINYFFIYCS